MSQMDQIYLRIIPSEWMSVLYIVQCKLLFKTKISFLQMPSHLSRFDLSFLDKTQMFLAIDRTENESFTLD